MDNTVGGVGLTAAKLKSTSGNAGEAFLSVETDQIRYTLDGTAPTSTVGHLLNPGDAMLLTGLRNLMAFRAIRVTTTASLRVTYFA